MTRLRLLYLWVELLFMCLASAQHKDTQRSNSSAKETELPISNWYFTVQVERGWFGWRTYYCQLATKASKSDARITSDIIDCSGTTVPHTSPFTFLARIEDQGRPALTGQPLHLLSFTHGLCSTNSNSFRQVVRFRGQPVSNSSSFQAGSRRSSTSEGQHGLEPAGQHNGREQDDPSAIKPSAHKLGDASVEGVSCTTEGGSAGSTFSLVSTAAEPGQPIPFSAPVYLLEGSKYCTITSNDFSDRALVCNLDDATTSVKLLFLPSAYPFAGLSSLFTGGSCGIKSLQEPPSHDVLCAQGRLALRQQSAAIQLRLPPDLIAAPLQGDVERETRLTLIMQTPGQSLASGSIVGLSVFYPGLAGRYLQTCCATKDPPHIIYCETAEENEIAAECWFQLQKVDLGNGVKELTDGSMVSLSAYAAGRFCSTSFDATLLCASSSFSTASRNIFILHLGQGSPVLAV